MSEKKEKMRASKELAQMALTDLRLIRSQLRTEDQAYHATKLDFLEQFIEAACRKLPTEASIQKDRNRPRKKAEQTTTA